ncbi:MAG: cobalt transporter [Rhizobiales bacterium]|nr:cobalt transporter [Hyphomicrobiales bacterium]
MLQRILISAIGAGLAVGLLTAAIQHVTTTPLVIAAEAYEQPGGGHDHGAADHAHSSDAAAHGAHTLPASGAETTRREAWAPEDGLERTFYTALTTSLTGVGFALMLLAAMVFKGGRIDERAGLFWGIGGFAAVALAPALGLPPELPASATADLAGRQIWWLGTIISSACGIGLLAFTVQWWARTAGVLLLAAPHIIGAPHPQTFTSAVPAELAGQFAATSLAVSAVFWVLLGWAAASLYQRLEPTPVAAE